MSGKILKGIARASLKLDFDNDNRDDGSLNPQIPDINLPEYLKDTSKSILVFDDLERCSISLNVLLGYINSFVEHQELKVIIIANEEELQSVENEIGKNKDLYRKIKEKLIGKTLKVDYNIEQAFLFFISQIENEDAKQFLRGNKNTIIEIFNTANYCNLRHLKQCLWDFERFYQSVPEEYRKDNDLMEVLLSHFLAFSFEIKSGQILPSDIENLSIALMTMDVIDKENANPPKPIEIVLEKYSFIHSYDMILPESSWRNLLGKGYLSEDDLIESLDKSKFCHNEKTPSWVKLWHYLKLEDDEFASLYSDVHTRWNEKEFLHIGEVLHICGLFLSFAEKGLIDRDIKDVLSECKEYIDYLKSNRELGKYKFNKSEFGFIERDQWGGLSFAGYELKEFQEVSAYVTEKMNEETIETLPDVGKKLIDVLKTNTPKFETMLYGLNTDDRIYYKTPIFKYIDPDEFFRAFMSISNSNKRIAIFAIHERINSHDHLSELVDEIDFLKAFDTLVSQEADKRKGRVSGYILANISSHYLKEMIKQFETLRRGKID